MLEFVTLSNENDYEKYKLDLQNTTVHMIKEKELANMLGYMLNISTLDELDKNTITSFFCIVFLSSENG